MRRIILTACLLLTIGCQQTPVSPSASALSGGAITADTLAKKPPKGQPPPPSGGSYQPFTGPLALTSWTVTDQQVRVLPLATPTFAFPSYPQTRNYLYKTQALALTAAQTLVIDFTVTPNPQFHADDSQPAFCTMPPMATPLIWHGDSLSTITDRYWAFNFKQVLTAGSSFHVEVPIVWTNWFDVYATQNASQFEAARTRINHIGLTFGQGCYYGHGLGLSSGSATFTLTRYEIR